MNEADRPSLLISWRFLMAIFLFTGHMLNDMQKMDMPIAIICMINQTALNLENKIPIESSNESTSVNISPVSYNNSAEKCHLNSHDTQMDGPFVWDKSIQGLVLSAYFYGYIFLQIPGGWLSYRFGSKIMLGLSMGVGSAITILIPFCARMHYWALIVCLFVKGAAHGSFWPSESSFWAYWAPVAERSRLVGFASSGAKVGNIVALSLGGVLCLYGIDGGWPSIFYLFGTIGVVWSILFFIFGADSPEKHRFIGEKEKKYMFKETKNTIALRNFVQTHVPWKQIFTSKAVYSIIIGHFSHGWVSWISINVTGVVVDTLLKRTKLSRTLIRRIFTSFGQFLPAITIIALSFVDCTKAVWAVVLLALSLGFDSIQMTAGYLVNIVDIAGPFSGILFGISNTIATLNGIIGPNLTAALTKHGLQSEWQKVFIITAVIYFVCGFINVLLLDADLQPWAKINDDDFKNKSHTNGSAKVGDIHDKKQTNIVRT